MYIIQHFQLVDNEQFCIILPAIDILIHIQQMVYFLYKSQSRYLLILLSKDPPSFDLLSHPFLVVDPIAILQYLVHYGHVEPQQHEEDEVEFTIDVVEVVTVLQSIEVYFLDEEAQELGIEVFAFVVDCVVEEEAGVDGEVGG